MARVKKGAADRGKKRYEIVTREGGAHGDLYETEQSFYWDVVDTRTGEVLKTFEGEAWSSLRGESHYSGVTKVELAGKKAVRVWTEGEAAPRRVPIPGA